MKIILFHLRIIQVWPVITGLTILVVLSVFNPIIEIPYNTKRIFVIFLLLTTCIYIILKREVFEELYIEYSKLSFFIRGGITFLFFIGLVSASLANNLKYSFLELGQFTLLFVFLAYIISRFNLDPNLFYKALGIALFSFALLYFIRFTINYSYIFFIPNWPVWPNLEFVNFTIDNELVYPKPFLGFVHVRFLNHIQTWTLPIFALNIISIPKKYWAYKSVSFLLTTFWWMLIFAADARGTMLASFVSFVIVYFIHRKSIKKWIYAYLLTAIIGFLGYYVLFKVLISEGGRSILSRYGDSGRLQMWQNALDLTMDNLFLGIGPMHYADISNGFKFAAPHNIYLQILSEWGLLFFIVLSSIIIIALYKWLTFKPKSEKFYETDTYNIKAALTASILAGGIHGFFSGIINTPLSQIVMVLVLGWAIGFYLKNNPTKSIKGFNIKETYLLKFILLLVAVFVGYASISTYSELEENRTEYLDKSELNVLYPRFWDYGKF